MLLPLTHAEAEAELARGALTLADVARRWRLSPEATYALLYQRPMPTPMAVPAHEGRTIFCRPRRTGRTANQGA